MAKQKKIRWVVSSGDISEVVFAANQFEAWDSLKARPATEFGMIAKAEKNEDGDPLLVRTSMLMFRWRRDAEAKLFVEQMCAMGYPDTTAADLASAGR